MLFLLSKPEKQLSLSDSPSSPPCCSHLSQSMLIKFFVDLLPSFVNQFQYGTHSSEHFLKTN